MMDTSIFFNLDGTLYKIWLEPKTENKQTNNKNEIAFQLRRRRHQINKLPNML
jgi:hypothetical protein